MSVDNTNPLAPIVNVPSIGVTSIQAGTNITVDNTNPASPIINATSGGGAWTLLEEIELLSDTAQVNFTGLNTNADLADGESYIIDVFARNNGLATPSLSLRFNNDTANNYRSLNSTTLVDFLNTFAYISASDGINSSTRIYIPAPKKRALYIVQTSIASRSGRDYDTFSADGFSASPLFGAQAWINTANITEINMFVAGQTLLTGSIFRLYKGNA